MQTTLKAKDHAQQEMANTKQAQWYCWRLLVSCCVRSFFLALYVLRVYVMDPSFVLLWDSCAYAQTLVSLGQHVFSRDFSLALFLLSLVSPVLNFKEKPHLILFCYYSLYTCLFSIERQNGCGQKTRGREEVGGVIGGKTLTKIHCMKNTPFLMEEK